MSNGGQNDFGHEYEVNSHRAHISAYVLIAGLVLEVINAVIWFHGPETIAGIVAVLQLSVAFGGKSILPTKQGSRATGSWPNTKPAQPKQTRAPKKPRRTAIRYDWS